MGTVGISFGSPTSGSGFDVSTTVSQIVSNLQAVETPWKNQLSALQSQDTALTSIGTDLSSLSSALSSLTDFEGVLSEMEGSSSDTSVLQLTGASSAAVAGSHTIVVSQLAQTDSWYSDGIPSSDTLSGTLSINGKTINITAGTTDSSGKTTGANDTLSTLAASINSGSYGVTASVVSGSGGSSLSLVSNTSGSSGEFTVGGSLKDASTSKSITFSEPQKGLDASFTVDGIPMTSSSNTVMSRVNAGTTVIPRLSSPKARW